MKKMYIINILSIIIIALAAACDWKAISVNKRAPDEQPHDPEGGKKPDDIGDDGENPVKTPTDLSHLEERCQHIVKAKPQDLPFVFSELEHRFLAAHNAVRKIYALPDLIWDHALASYAQEWADYLRDNNQCKMIHRSHAGMTGGKSYGENLAWNWTSKRVPLGVYEYTPEKSNYNWSAECADYDYQNNSCTPGEQCGHFTQVVWRDSKRVGCGVATCNEGDGVFKDIGRSEIWVCNYSPPGNWVGKKPF